MVLCDAKRTEEEKIWTVLCHLPFSRNTIGNMDWDGTLSELRGENTLFWELFLSSKKPGDGFFSPHSLFQKFLPLCPNSAESPNQSSVQPGREGICHLCTNQHFKYIMCLKLIYRKKKKKNPFSSTYLIQSEIKIRHIFDWWWFFYSKWLFMMLPNLIK